LSIKDGHQTPDGAGLFCGVLKHFLDRGPDCPKVLAATHFHEVFTEKLLNPRNIPIMFCHMQVIFCASEAGELENGGGGGGASLTSSQRNGIKTGSGDKITYLYRVVEGLSLDSHAGKCAILCGLPGRIVQRARYVRYDSMKNIG
jgi:DNA mismatch repair protein MSH5